jgi:hypothetical protein
MDPLNQPQAQAPEIMQHNPTPVGDGKPYFMGDHALIKFSSGEEGLGPDTYWLVDKKDHTIRPFESNMALDAAFGQDLQTALQKAITVSSPAIDGDGNINDGVLTDFTLLSPDYMIKEDGSTKPLAFSPHHLRQRYGKPIDESLESLSTEAVDNFLGLMIQQEDKTMIPASFVQGLKRDHQLMAFYISALAYGDYTLNDVYLDIAHRYHQK